MVQPVLSSTWQKFKHCSGQAAMYDRAIIVIWSWPKMPRKTIGPPNQHHRRYANWASQMWEPSKEPDDTIEVSSAIIAWTNPNRHLVLCYVHGIHIKKEIIIPDGEVHHIQLHLNAQENISIE